MTRLGIYVGNDVVALAQFEDWLGSRVDFCSIFLGMASWSDFVGSADWCTDLATKFGRPALWSVPLIPHGADLARAASGAYDEHYRSVASKLARAISTKRIYVRTGWEQNGTWMPWSARGIEVAYVAAFRRFVDCFRQITDRVDFVWCPNIGQDDPANTYPGDAFVDVIGLDVYHFPKTEPQPADQAWQYMVTRSFGLQWHLQFSKLHRKPIAFPEWGVSSDNLEGYVNRMAAWIREGDALYQCYWNSNAEYRGRLSDGQYPATGMAYRSDFSRR